MPVRAAHVSPVPGRLTRRLTGFRDAPSAGGDSSASAPVLARELVRHLRRVHRVAETPAIGVRRDGEPETVGRAAAAHAASNTIAAAYARRAKEHDAFFVDDVKRRARTDAKRSVRGDERVGPIVRSTLEPRAGFLATLAEAMDGVRIEWVRGVGVRAQGALHALAGIRISGRGRGGAGECAEARGGGARAGGGGDPREGARGCELGVGLEGPVGRYVGVRSSAGGARGGVVARGGGKLGTLAGRRELHGADATERAGAPSRGVGRAPAVAVDVLARARHVAEGQDAPGARARRTARGTHLPGLAGAGSAHGRARRDVTARAALTRAVQQLLRETHRPPRGRRVHLGAALIAHGHPTAPIQTPRQRAFESDEKR